MWARHIRTEARTHAVGVSEKIAARFSYLFRDDDVRMAPHYVFYRIVFSLAVAKVLDLHFVKDSDQLLLKEFIKS